MSEIQATDLSLGEKPRENRLQRFSRKALRVVGLLFAADVALLAVLNPTPALYVLATLAMLLVIVVAHEYGHYRVAKKAGLGIDEFSVGFGPRLFSRKNHGIRWSLKAIPLGGSVRIQGMTVEDAQKRCIPRSKSYVHARAWTRLKLALAGPAVNVALAWASIAVVKIGMGEPGKPWWVGVLISPWTSVGILWRVLVLTGQSLAHALTLPAGMHSVIALPHLMQQSGHVAMAAGIPTWAFVLVFFGLVNLSLAVFNVLPLFPLDGYHAVVAVVDGVRRRIGRRAGRAVEPLAMRQMAWYVGLTGAAFLLFSVILLGRDLVGLFNGSLF